MKIAIRADGGSQIGMGHVMRTLVLAKELTKTNDVFYVCRVDNKFINNQGNNTETVDDRYKKGIDKVKSEGFEVKYINENSVIEELKNIEADLLITDSYDVDENYFFETKKVFKKTAYIDDMNLHYFDVDILINQNINGIDLDYKVNEYTKLLVGLNYVMLREEFRNISKKLTKDKVEHIMVTIGGSDPNHFTEKIINWVEDLDYNFHVVIGPSFEISNFIDYKSEKVKIYYNADMCKIMQACQIAISACGSTLYELAACGVPTLGIIIAENQQEIAYKLNAEDIIRNLGWYNELNKDEFIDNIKDIASNYKLRKQMSYAGRRIIDAKGVENIVEIINYEMLKKN